MKLVRKFTAFVVRAPILKRKVFAQALDGGNQAALIIIGFEVHAAPPWVGAVAGAASSGPRVTRFRSRPSIWVSV